MARAIVCALAFAVLAGCSTGPPLIDVSGDVTLDGAPFGTGNDAQIRFEPNGKLGNSLEAFIVQGKYAGKLTPGIYKVSITWNRSTGKKAQGNLAGPGEDAEAVEVMIPAKYNDATTLTAQVDSSSKVHNFALTKK